MAKLLHILKKLSREKKRVTIPTLLTIARIVLTPCIVVSMIWQHWGMAFGLFCSAAITDLADGFLARWWNQMTFLGACLDPVADKVLLVSCFVTLAFVQSPLFAIPLWFVLFIVCKEALLISGSAVVWYTKGDLYVNPTPLSKLTTLAQVCFIIWLFACYFFHWLPIKTYAVMLGVLFILTAATLIQYLIIGWRLLIKG